MFEVKKEERELLFDIADFLLKIRDKKENPTDRNDPAKTYQEKIVGLFGHTNWRGVANMLYKKTDKDLTPILNWTAFRKFKKSFANISTFKGISDDEARKHPYLRFANENRKKFERILLDLEEKFKTRPEINVENGKPNNKKRKNGSGTNKKSTSLGDQFLETFQNTQWFSYTRLLRPFPIGSIGRKILEFGEFDKNNECPVTVSHFTPNIPIYQGKATLNDVDRMLILEVTDDDTKSLSKRARNLNYYFFKIPLPLKVLEVCVGLYLFQNMNMGSMVVYRDVLVRCAPDEKDFTTATFDFDDIRLDKNVREYLRVYDLNYMQTPQFNIYDFLTLEGGVRNDKERIQAQRKGNRKQPPRKT